MNTSELETKLLTFLQREIFAPETLVTVDTDLIAAGFDSMSLVRLLVFIEMTCGLWLPEHEINATTLRNLRSLAATITRLQHEGSSAA